MKKLIILCVLAGLLLPVSHGQLIEEIVNGGNPWVQDVMSKAEQYEVQIIYSQIIRDANGVPSIKKHTFGVDEDRYFYPASTVKFPVALFALEKLNELQDQRLTRHTPIAFGAMRGPQFPVFSDATAKNGVLTLDHLIKKIFLVSDNDANNLLYSFCGHDYVKNKLEQKGYEKARIGDRVGAGSFSHEENKSTNSFLFYNQNKILYVQPGQTGNATYNLALKDCIKGVAYYDDGEIIDQPFNFCEKNYLSLPTLHDVLISVVLPEAANERAHLNLTDDQRKMVLSYMSERPRESTHPKYGSEYYDSYVKFLMVGDNKNRMPDNIRIFNKVGDAHGYLTDAAYIVDLDRGIEFVLVASLHMNENQTFNDDTYEYDTIGFPFLGELGRLFYEYEKSRNHTFDTQKLRQLNYD